MYVPYRTTIRRESGPYNYLYFVIPELLAKTMEIQKGKTITFYSLICEDQDFSIHPKGNAFTIHLSPGESESVDQRYCKKVFQRGNSMLVRLPEPIVREFNPRKNSKLYLKIEGKSITGSFQESYFSDLKLLDYVTPDLDLKSQVRKDLAKLHKVPLFNHATNITAKNNQNRAKWVNGLLNKDKNEQLGKRLKELMEEDLKLLKRIEQLEEQEDSDSGNKKNTAELRNAYYILKGNLKDISFLSLQINYDFPYFNVTSNDRTKQKPKKQEGGTNESYPVP
jgi:antitoxin component of MazEF toxin-antitoxin module